MSLINPQWKIEKSFFKNENNAMNESELHLIEKWEELHSFSSFSNNLILENEGFGHLFLIFIFILLQQNKRKSVLFEKRWCLQWCFCWFDCLEIFKKSLKHLFLVGWIVLRVLKVFQFRESYSGTCNDQLNEFA